MWSRDETGQVRVREETAEREALDQWGRRAGLPLERTGGPRRVAPGKRPKEQVTHVIGVEALAHACRHIESALQGTEPHHVWNVVAKKPQSPEPRKQRAAGSTSGPTLHRYWGPGSSELQSGWKTAARPFTTSRCTALCPLYILTRASGFLCQSVSGQCSWCSWKRTPIGARRARATLVPRVVVFSVPEVAPQVWWGWKRTGTGPWRRGSGKGRGTNYPDSEGRPDVVLTRVK